MPLTTRSKSRTVILSHILKDANDEKLVLFITGAGISKESGVPLYRSDNSRTKKSEFTIWNSYVEEWCTISKFLDNPENWYRDFWKKSHMTEKIRNAKPNFSHYSIAKLCQSDPLKFKIITQNVDCLHRKAGTPEECLIEGHGCHDYFRCINHDEKCIKSYQEPITVGEICNYNDYRLAMSSKKRIYTTQYLPKCPVCKHICMPMILTFGESYNSHSFFQWDKAKQWMLLADVIIFVGTSFSVTLTDFALLCCMIKKTTFVYNINNCPKASLEFNFSDRQHIEVTKMWNFIKSYYTQKFSSSKVIQLMEMYIKCNGLEEILIQKYRALKLLNKDDYQFFQEMKQRTNYLCNRENWLKMDESCEDRIISTAHFNNICTIVNTASDQFRKLGI